MNAFKTAVSSGTDCGTTSGTNINFGAPEAPCSDVSLSLEREHGTGLTGWWDKDQWQEFFEERAAIYEFEAGMTRADAERAALLSCKIEAMRYLNRDRAHIGWPAGKLRNSILLGQLAAADAMMQAVGLETWRPSLPDQWDCLIRTMKR